MKYAQYDVTFSEIPDETCLVFSITGCKNICKGCHSPYLRENTGDSLNSISLNKILDTQKFITCVVFFGGDDRENQLIELLKVCLNRGFKTALYSGRDDVSPEIKQHLSYVKLGAFKEELGGLSSKNTNQKMFNLISGEDITYKFWDKQ